MSADPITVWWDWGCWLLGFRFNRNEIGICLGPLTISIIPSLF